MHRLQLLQGDQWSLLNEQDDEAFRGSLSECEAWLDRQENQTPVPARNFFSDFKLRDWIHRIWAGAPVVPLHCSPVAQSNASSFEPPGAPSS